MNLELPLPPSANVYWRFSRKVGRPYLSSAARAYRKQVLRLYSPRPLTGRVAVRLDVYLCRGDLDNRIKVTLDALKGLAYLDDNAREAVMRCTVRLAAQSTGPSGVQR